MGGFMTGGSDIKGNQLLQGNTLGFKKNTLVASRAWLTKQTLSDNKKWRVIIILTH